MCVLRKQFPREKGAVKELKREVLYNRNPTVPKCTEEF